MDFLDKIRPYIAQAIRDGFYNVRDAGIERLSLARVVDQEPFSLIPVIEHRSPVEPKLFDGDVDSFASELKRAGAHALSVVCERDFFSGDLADISATKPAGLPVLYKDFVIDPVQIEAAAKCGADAVLLIHSLFDKRYTTLSIHEMIEHAHNLGLDTLLEVFSLDEFVQAMETESDLIGINNRNLKTLKVDLAATEQILSQVTADRPVISESGVKRRADMERMMAAGADGILVGTAILKSCDPVGKVEELLGVPV